MRKHLGTVLIVLSLILLEFIYVPYLQSFLVTESQSIPTSGNFISIPKINALAPVISNVDPWSEKDYKDALKKGIAQAKDMPNFYFAHSSLPPWEMTRTNTSFLRLGQLKVGDEITIIKDGVRTKYSVAYKKEVWPTEVQALKNSGDGIILQTCTPPGTDWKRLLVFANKK